MVAILSVCFPTCEQNRRGREKTRERERMSERENAGERAMILRDQGNEEEVVLKREGDVVSRRE